MPITIKTDISEIKRYACAPCEAADGLFCFTLDPELAPAYGGFIVVDCGCANAACADCAIPGSSVACADCGMQMARTPMSVRRRRCGECYAAVKRGGYRGVAARDLTREAQERQQAGFTPDYAITTAEALGYL